MKLKAEVKKKRMKCLENPILTRWSWKFFSRFDRG